MDDRRITISNVICMVAMFWLWVHAMLFRRFLEKDHPYKKRKNGFSLVEVARGEYLEYRLAWCFGLVFWVLILLLTFFAYALFIR